MDTLQLNAFDREVLGKKVKKLRQQGILPAHVYGNSMQVEHISVDGHDFSRVFKQVGETGLVDLKIGEDRIRPVLIKEVDIDPVTDKILHVGFYQVNLKEKVTVPVPIVLIGEGPESVKMGDTVVLQTLNEVNVEALPTDLVENIEVNIEVLKEVGDVITVADLSYDRSKLTILSEPEEVVVKLDTAVTEEMKKLLEEQQAEAAAAAEAVQVSDGEQAVEGEETAEGEEEKEGEAGENATEGKEEGNVVEEKPEQVKAE